jgi:replicative DNA helicase
MGKTVFGRGEALSIAKQKIKAPEGNEINQPVLYVSTEVSEEQLVEQLLASHSGVSKEIVEGERAGNELDYARLGEVAEEFYNLPMYYLCRGDKSLVKIKQKAEEVKRIHGVYPIIILDYLQALVRGGETGKSYQVGAFLSDLKNWIQDEQICVLALAQLSRDSAKPDKDGKVKLPSITDIADSKAVEDWAATIVILHRPEYYESRAEGRDEYEQSEVLMVCCKVRYGKSGVSKALFAPSRALFFDYGNEPKKSEMKQGVLA